MDSVPNLDTYWFFNEEWDSYEELYNSFDWELPETFNTAEYVCDRWAADTGKTALFAENSHGERQTFTFWQLRNHSNQLANWFEEQGITRGDRVAVTGTQTPETLITMLAAWKVGAIAVPVSVLFGSDGLRYRLADCAAKVFVADRGNVDTYREVQDELPGIEHTFVAEGVELQSNERAFWGTLPDYSRDFDPVSTSPEDNATIIYTSGTTGQPKGVVLPHQVLLGQLPGFAFKHLNFDVNEQDVIWMLAEWSWIGVYGFILPSLFYGRPVVGYEREQFDPEKVFDLVDTYGISYFSCTPTAVRMMMQVDTIDEYDLRSIRVIGVGAEKVSGNVLKWVDETFGSPAINVGYGQTECCLPLGECTALGKKRDGSIGVPVPGHEVRIVNLETATTIDDPGEVGEIAVKYEGDPLCFKEYWNKPDKTAAKIRNGWLLTEDLGHVDEDGFFHFQSRKDDVIISSGYRLGPEEIEGALAEHEAVVDAGVIGIPDETRGEIPKAFVQLADGHDRTETIIGVLQQHVKDKLAKYEYPREIEFIDDLPKTSTGKIRRTDLRIREGLEEE